MFEDGTQEWRGELTELNLPQEALTWKPFENFQSIGNIIQHIADVEETWIHKMAGYREISEEELFRIFDPSSNYNKNIYDDAPDQLLDAYFARCDEVRKKSLEIIQKWDDPTNASIRVEKDYGYTLRWILHHVITHEAYHGGQAVLLGMMWGENC